MRLVEFLATPRGGRFERRPVHAAQLMPFTTAQRQTLTWISFGFVGVLIALPVSAVLVVALVVTLVVTLRRVRPVYVDGALDSALFHG